MVAGALFVAWSLGLTLLVLAIAWLVFVQLGLNPNSSEISQAQLAQVSFWVTIWSVLAVYVIQRLLRHRRRIFARYSRRLLLIAIPTGLIVGSLTTAGLSIAAYHTPESPELCSIQDTLKVALASTLAIDTNQGNGSGFVIDNQGYVVTNYHVIEGATALHTWLDEQTQVPLEVVRTSPEHDLALLRLAQPIPQHLTFAGLDDTHPAEEVFAIGFPGNAFSGGYATVTSGVVSRKVIPAGSYDLPPDIELFQTDAAINPGNSGGPIISKCGVIGVIAAISTSDSQFGGLPREEGISYAISSETVKRVLELP